MAVAAVVVRSPSPQQQLALEIEPPRTCGTCHGSCFMWSGASRSTVAIDLRCPRQLRPGEQVQVSLPASVLATSALLVHGLPWLGVVAGGLIGQAATHTDTGCLAGVLAGVLLAVLAVRRVQPKLEAVVAAELDIRPS